MKAEKLNPLCLFLTLALGLFIAGCAGSENDVTSSSLTDEVENAISITDLQNNVLTDVHISVVNADSLTGEQTNIIIIDNIINACKYPPCELPEAHVGKLTIVANSVTFFLTEDTETVIIPIPDQPGAATSLSNNLGESSLLNSEGDPIVYKFIGNYRGIPVTELVSFNKISELIKVTFNTQPLAVSLVADTIVISGTNTVDGYGTIDIGPVFPASYDLASVNLLNINLAYAFADPDGVDTKAIVAELPAIHIGERDANGMITDNEKTYDVTLNLVAPRLVTHEDIMVLTTTKEPLTNATVSVSHFPAEIVVNGITNGCTIPPCINAASEIIANIFIAVDSSIFTIADNNDVIAIPDQAGAATLADVTVAEVELIRNSDNIASTYKVIVHYSGMPVSDLVDNANIGNVINAFFANNPLTVALTVTSQPASQTISLSGTNSALSPIYANTIVNGSALPSGYQVTETNGSPYTFFDPSGSSTAQYDTESLVEGNLIIAERNISSGKLINNNQETYNLTLELSPANAFDGSYVALSSSIPAANGNFWVDPNIVPVSSNGIVTNTGRIVINITNVCTVPCQLIEDSTLGNLTITEMPALFMINSVKKASTAGIPTPTFYNGSAVFGIPDQDGARSVANFELGNITISNIGDTMPIEYAIIVHYQGKSAAEIVSDLNGIANVIILGSVRNNVNVNFLSQSTDSNVDPDPILVAWEHYIPTIQDNVLIISNLQNSYGNIGTGTLTFVPSVGLPSGYYVLDYTFNNPIGQGSTNISGKFAIAEGDALLQSVTSNNQAFYELDIQMDAIPVELAPQDLDIYVIDTLRHKIHVDASQLSIDTTSSLRSITIKASAGLTNFNSVTTPLFQGKVILSAAVGSDISLLSTNLTQFFYDPSGITTKNITLKGNFTATKGFSSTDYKVTLEFSPL